MEVISVGIINEPPYHMRWLKDHPNKSVIVLFVTDLAIDHAELLKQTKNLEIKAV